MFFEKKFFHFNQQFRFWKIFSVYQFYFQKYSARNSTYLFEPSSFVIIFQKNRKIRENENSRTKIEIRKIHNEDIGISPF